MIAARRPACGPLVLGVLALASLVPLLVWDVAPALFPPGSHDAFGALPLAAIAVAYLVHQATRRISAREWLRAAILAAAFLAWAANQFWPDHLFATLWNDVAIALFVVDVVLAMWERPAATGATE